MQTSKDDILLQQLKTEANAPFHLLYKLYFPSVASYIKQNNGNSEDAEDIFQEAIMVLLQKVRQPDFVLSSTLKTFLYAIAKNLWLKRLRTNNLIAVDELENYEIVSDTFFFELAPEKSKEDKVSVWLAKITAHCLHVLKAIFFYQEPMVNLMRKMGWKNKHTAANQQYKCIQQVKKVKEKEEGA